jgi:hypothetical protein
MGEAQPSVQCKKTTFEAKWKMEWPNGQKAMHLPLSLHMTDLKCTQYESKTMLEMMWKKNGYAINVKCLFVVDISRFL